MQELKRSQNLLKDMLKSQRSKKSTAALGIYFLNVNGVSRDKHELTQFLRDNYVINVILITETHLSAK